MYHTTNMMTEATPAPIRATGWGTTRLLGFSRALIPSIITLRAMAIITTAVTSEKMVS